jgi:alpha-D-xyloside xylohydrolase
MSPFITDHRSLRWRGSGETVVVEAWGRDSLRVRAWRTAGREQDWALLPPAESGPEITVDGDVASIVNGGITAVLRARAELDGQTGYLVAECSIEFQRPDGSVLLRELSSGGSLKRRARHWRPITGSSSSHLTAAFEAHPDEHLSGMGQYQQALIDLKGATLELAHRNSQASVPFLVSDRGYGLLWNNPAIGRATFAVNRTEFVAEATGALDYWITAGATPAAISRSYADATGHAPVMPEYGLGFWQCKLRYWNQEQLLEVAREHHRRGIPIDVIVADFFHWPELGDYRFEQEFWPDPAAMVRELDALGIKLMVSVWPQVSARSENFDRFVRENLLVTADRGMNVQMAFGGPSAFLDVTNPDARAALWELCKANYHDAGIELFWLDEAEPEYGVYDFENYRYHSGSVLETGNAYPQQFSRAFWEGQRAAGQTEIVNLVRCAWAGSQRYGALAWSGDIQSSWEDLRAQIVAGIHMGVAGIPWFTTDIGGFHGGDPTDAAFRELLIRWFQFGAFCPVMRLHGDRRPTEQVRASDGSERLFSGADNEIWSFGDASPILEAQIGLRERLRDYSREAMRTAHEHGTPVMRGLFYEFPLDPGARGIADQYLYGSDLLVCPVLEAGARSRSVYLPAGATWWDLRTGAEHRGGGRVEAAAPLESIPVFTRDRSLVEQLR